MYNSWTLDRNIDSSAFSEVAMTMNLLLYAFPENENLPNQLFLIPHLES